MGEGGRGEGNYEGRIIRVELPKTNKYEGVSTNTNFGMEYSEEGADISAIAEDAIPIKITIGAREFKGISPSDDKEPVNLENSDVALVFDEGWRQRIDLHSKGYRAVKFMTAPTGKDWTNFYSAYVPKDSLNEIESLFSAKELFPKK